MTATFSESTGVTGRGDGAYTGHVDPTWNLRPLPQGGIVSALALRAMAAELDDPTQQLRTLHTGFVAKVAHGDVDIDVELLRRGRSMSHLRAEVRRAGEPRGHVTTAIFGSTRRGFDFTDAVPPAAAPPSDCPSFRDPPPPGVEPLPPLPFWSAVEGRPAMGHRYWEEFPPGRAERAGWYRFEHAPRRADGTLDPLALVVLADFMPGAVGEHLGSRDRDEDVWFAPSIDLTVHLLDDCRSEWVLAHNTARWAGEGYASADMDLWDCGEDGTGPPRLVAHATQMFLFSFSAG